MTKQEIIKELKVKKVEKMMDEDQYWNIVETVLNHPAGCVTMEKSLVDLLKHYPLRDTVEFHLRTQNFTKNLDNDMVHDVGSSLNKRYLGDDAFEYFRWWILSQGKDIYYQAKTNPQSLLEKYKSGGHYGFENFGYVAQISFEHRTNSDLYDFI